MKKLLSILLATTLLLTLFIGCSKSDEPTDASTKETVTTETVEDIVDELTEDVTVEETTVDDDGNEITVGKDADGNTVEIKTAKDGTVTKTVTDKNTGKKTEQTTTVATKPVPTKPNNGKSDTTKPSATKPADKTTTTTKPSTTKPTTTAHTHNYQPVYKTEPIYETQKVLVKEAYDEPEMVCEQAYYCSGCGVDCFAEARKYGLSTQMFHMKHCKQGPWAERDTGMPVCDMHLMPNAPMQTMRLSSGSGLGLPNFKLYPTGKTIHHDAVYEDKKVQTGTKQVITGYKCSCGATKPA